MGGSEGVHIFQTFLFRGSKYFDIFGPRGIKIRGFKIFVTGPWRKHRFINPRYPGFINLWRKELARDVNISENQENISSVPLVNSLCTVRTNLARHEQTDRTKYSDYCSWLMDSEPQSPVLRSVRSKTTCTETKKFVSQVSS